MVQWYIDVEIIFIRRLYARNVRCVVLYKPGVYTKRDKNERLYELILNKCGAYA